MDIDKLSVKADFRQESGCVIANMRHVIREPRVRQTNPSEYDIGSGWEYLYTREGGYKLTEDGSRVENVWLAKEGVIPKKAGSWRFDRGQIIGDDWNEVKQFRY